jgi:hypothetical protein
MHSEYKFRKRGKDRPASRCLGFRNEDADD